MRLNTKVGGKKNRNKTLHSACSGILSVPPALIPLKGSVSQEVSFYCQHSPGSLALWFSTGVVSLWKARGENPRMQGWNIVPCLPCSTAGWQWLYSSKEGYPVKGLASACCCSSFHHLVTAASLCPCKSGGEEFISANRRVLVVSSWFPLTLPTPFINSPQLPQVKVLSLPWCDLDSTYELLCISFCHSQFNKCLSRTYSMPGM